MSLNSFGRMLGALGAVILAGAAASARGATYYVSQSDGNDASTGQTASPAGPKGPWKTLARASQQTYAPGDKLLLKRGDVWNEELRPLGNGTPTEPIEIGSYGDAKPRPVIDREDDLKDRIGLHLVDQEGFKVVGLEFHRCQTGIYGEYSVGSPNRKYLWIEDCYFHDSLLYQQYQDYPKRKIGLGICLFSHETKNTIVASDITVRSGRGTRLAPGRVLRPDGDQRVQA